ncbi:MAG: 30S ribosomal protein S15 [Sphingobacteriales bacterium 17-39-43]|jgi:small subunit ribosomal protein S15|uniref:30S ribosomal protein S15 n=1 Tax=Daejeonella sp. TaxID=2805397 RepID=UPI000BDD2F42|nr:30S ribosomal protein S15 [Daejeonella sp.]MCF8453939.1 30S ribosomal protein S15 [Pedobacter sp.]OYZ33512.1 MAG: 30S ribosomal protein S15 [Sphingobacteriales bacterium 16-39-50]OZA26768.1 MAG: 30S ribosomal protein S15 [Sphingobacteriales bacterium 17-39-43]MDP2413597.1 30S ribosomal protein S15 [Daejeonella sp.]HQT21478.1 30S ribosomal protein S15 [Daejeonella sp.]
MYLSTEYKADIFAKHGKGATDTGSAEGQVALFTARIAHLTGHLKQNKKDFSTQLSLQKLVGKRRALLAYLYKKDINRYRAIIKALELRDIIK